MSLSNFPTTSASLMERIRASDAQSWDRLVRLYGPLIYRWCRRWHLQAADAKDIVQEVFSAVALHIDGFHRQDGQGGFRSWLFTITRNKVRDFYRKGGERAKAHGGTAAQERLDRIAYQEASGDGSAADPSDQILLVRRAVQLVQGEFEERTWEMFFRTALLAERPAQVAVDFQVSVSAVYQAKSRVLRRLRQVLDEPRM